MAFTRNWPFFAGVVCYTVAAYISGGVTDLLNVEVPSNMYPGTKMIQYAGIWSSAIGYDPETIDIPGTAYTYISCTDVQTKHDQDEREDKTTCPYDTGAYCRGMQSASGISISFMTLLLLHEIWVLGAGGDDSITMNAQYLFRAVGFLMSMVFLLFMISVAAARKEHADCDFPSIEVVGTTYEWEYGSSFIVLCVFFGLGTVLFFGGAINRRWGDNSGVWPATSFMPLSQM